MLLGAEPRPQPRNARDVTGAAPHKTITRPRPHPDMLWDDNIVVHVCLRSNPSFEGFFHQVVPMR